MKKEEAWGQGEGTRPNNSSNLAPPSLKLSLVAVFLVSLAVLVFEVALTRVLSVMLAYHFVFAILSAALFGLGAGALVFKHYGRWLDERALWVGAVAFSLSLPGALFGIVFILPGSEAWVGVRLTLYLSLATLPFGAAGFVISGIFQKFSAKSSLLYGADLLGAAVGAVVVVPSMNLIGPVNLVLLVGAVAALAAVLLGLPNKRRLLVGAVAIFVFAGVATGALASGLEFMVPIPADPRKDMALALADPKAGFRVAESRWSAFGRTDLLESPLYPLQKYVFIDGAAGSVMYNLDAILNNPRAQASVRAHSGELFALQFLDEEQRRTALVLGPGGGQDVVMAILGGVKDITAVEVNPDIVSLVKRHKDFSGGIYSGRPGVTVVVAEGRNFVRTSKHKYDLIIAALPITKSSRSVEGYVLTENNLFTVEAFQDYLEHLTDRGRLMMVAHNDQEIYRMIRLTLAAFGKKGLSETEAMKHLYTVASPMLPTLVVQKAAVSVAEAEAVHAKVHEEGFDRGILFIPHVRQEIAQFAGSSRVVAMLDPRLVAIAEGKGAAVVLDATNFDLRPTTDDRPFFYDFAPGLPTPFPVFFGLIVAAAVVFGVLLLLPAKPRLGERSGFGSELLGSPTLKVYLGLFFALGMAYMVVEIAVFQKLGLYISQPQMNLTVLLFSLLLGSGVGSLLSGLVGRRLRWTAAGATGSLAALIAVFPVVLPRAFALGADPRLTAFVLVFPLGLLGGFPFPAAMRCLTEDGYAKYTALMWGVNGVTSVLGSTLAMIIGLTWGFSRALLVGAAIYLSVGAVFALVGTRTTRETRDLLRS